MIRYLGIPIGIKIVFISSSDHPEVMEIIANSHLSSFPQNKLFVVIFYPLLSPIPRKLYSGGVEKQPIYNIGESKPFVDLLIIQF